MTVDRGRSVGKRKAFHEIDSPCPFTYIVSAFQTGEGKWAPPLLDFHFLSHFSFPIQTAKTPVTDRDMTWSGSSAAGSRLITSDHVLLFLFWVVLDLVCRHHDSDHRASPNNTVAQIACITK